MAELVDALDSKSSSARSAGSIPARGTKHSTFSETPGYSTDTLKIARVIGRLRGHGSAHGSAETIRAGVRAQIWRDISRGQDGTPEIFERFWKMKRGRSPVLLPVGFVGSDEPEHLFLTFPINRNSARFVQLLAGEGGGMALIHHGLDEGRCQRAGAHQIREMLTTTGSDTCDVRAEGRQSRVAAKKLRNAIYYAWLWR